METVDSHKNTQKYLCTHGVWAQPGWGTPVPGVSAAQCRGSTQPQQAPEQPCPALTGRLTVYFWISRTYFFQGLPNKVQIAGSEASRIPCRQRAASGTLHNQGLSVPISFSSQTQEEKPCKVATDLEEASREPICPSLMGDYFNAGSLIEAACLPACLAKLKHLFPKAPSASAAPTPDQLTVAADSTKCSLPSRP